MSKKILNKKTGRWICLAVALLLAMVLIPVGVFAAEDDMPNATVTQLPATTISAGDYMTYPSGDTGVDRPLDILMKFAAQDTYEEAAAGTYAKWITDFYVTANGFKDGSAVLDGCYLAGNYGSYGWVVIPLDGFEAENGVAYPVVGNFDPNLTYENICDYVKEFIAAIYIDRAVISENPDMSVTLTLKMTDPEDSSNVLVVNSVVYTAPNFGAVAEVGGKAYFALEDAIAAVPSDGTKTEVTLLADIDLGDLNADPIVAGEGGVVIAKNQNVVLNLAGHKISAERSAAKNTSVILNKGTLTVKDSVGGGEIYMDSSKVDDPAWSSLVAAISNTGSLTVDGGYIHIHNGKGMGYAIDTRSGYVGAADVTVTVNGGTVEAHNYIGIRMFANYASTDSGKISVTVNGGTVNGATNGIWLQQPSTNPSAPAEINVNGGVVSGGKAAINNYVINGSPADVKVVGGTVSSANGSAVTATVWPGDGTNDFAVVVTGGNLNSAVADNVALTDGTNTIAAGEGQTVDVSGGYFSKPVADEDCAEGYYPVTIAAGKYSVTTKAVAKIGEKKYATLAQAFAAVPTDGTETTVTLIDDIDLGDLSTNPVYPSSGEYGNLVAKGQNVVLDLAGHKITAGRTVAKNTSIILNKGTLTVKDSVGNGEIYMNSTVDDAGWTSLVAAISNCGTLNVESGYIHTNNGKGMGYAIDHRTNGDEVVTTNINGGTVAAPDYIGIRIFANNAKGENVVNINGGTVSGNDGIWLQQPNAKPATAEININDGKVEGVRSAFRATIANDETKADIYIHHDAEVSPFLVNNYELKIHYGKDYELTAGYTGTSSNEAVAVVEGDKLITKAPGEAALTFTNESGASYTVNLTVVADVVEVTVTPDSLYKLPGEEDPELTYTLSQDVAVSGKLARAEGEESGAYAINLGTLKATNAERIVNKWYQLVLRPMDFVIMDTSDYEARTISSNGVTVSGDLIHKDAVLVVEDIADAAILEKLNGYLDKTLEMVLTKEVHLELDGEKVPFIGKIDITFTVGKTYNGRAARVWHIVDEDTTDTAKDVVAKGVVVVEGVTELSPFGVAVTKSSGNGYGTGENIGLKYVLPICLFAVSFFAVAYFVFKKRDSIFAK